MRKSIVALGVCCLLFAALSAGAAGAGGRIAGIVTDAKGAVIVGATVTVTPSGGGPSRQAVTNKEGRYQIEDLPGGTYVVVVSATGFAGARREEVAVTERGVRLDVQLEVAALNAGNVEVKAAGTKPNADPVYQRLRQAASNGQELGGPVAAVNNLVLQRDAATFTLKSGELYFLAPVEGRTTGAVFVGEGTLALEPPTEVEKHSLSLFTDQPGITEDFSSLVLRFTDQTLDEIKSSPAARVNESGAQARRARDLYRDNLTVLRKELHVNLDAQTLADIYAPARPGFFHAFVNGRRFKKLFFVMNPRGIPDVSPEEVTLASYGETDGGIWTAFHLRDEYRQGTATSKQNRRVYDITRHDIDAAIRGTRLAATDQITLRSLLPGTRVIPFDLYGTLRVRRVQDAEGRDLDFIQEDKDDDPDFAVILPQPAEQNGTIRLTVQYDGEGAIKDSGGGNFILIPRSSWYPNNGGSQFGDRALFNMTFRYPKGNIFVGTGEPTGPEAEDGDVRVSKWSSGQTELAVAGFNYGRFKMKDVADAATGYRVEFYANREVPDELRDIQMQIERAEQAGHKTMTTLGSISTTQMADQALADAQNATRVFQAFFGKLPYTRLAMTQQPAINFGQAWPTLVFMPYAAFIDTTQRTQLLGVRGGIDNFWRYVGPHELAHQWWGHVIGWESYRDQWMSEGFAEFSASLYVQYVRKDLDKFTEFWEHHRKEIIEASAATKGKKPYTVGPVTQGYRLSNGKNGAAYRFLVYPKGAYILHMLRMMMYDPRQGGDRRFQAMMNDFIKTHYNTDVSTEDFKQIVDKHMPPDLNPGGNGRMDWFFDEWVYGTEMPSYRFDYRIATAGDKATLTGKITQSGVSDKFRMRVPVYLDYGKGWTSIGSATLVGSSSLDINVPLAQTPKRAALAALNDVLAASIENNKN